MIQKLRDIRSRNNSESGFTIIEVLIVLAIAGLIMLIVFLAVPALNRNSRNTQYRHEASQLLAGAQETINLKNGTALVGSVSTTNPSDAYSIMQTTKNKNITVLTIEAEALATVPTLSSAVLRSAAKCNTAFNETDPGAPRGLAILIQIENNSGTGATICVES